MQIRYQGSGHHYFSAKVDDFFDKDTPTPPTHIKSEHLRHGVHQTAVQAFFGTAAAKK